MEKIAIFCAASDSIDAKYVEKAKELGTWMGQQHKTLVYGGSNAGLMEAIALAVKTNGGTVMGVVPTLLENNGKKSDLLDITFRTDNLSDRKDTMLRESEVLVALPGGVGTLDEVFHVMATSTLNYHHKPIIFYNVDGFWNDLLSFLEHLYDQHFMHKSLTELYAVANNLEELTDLIH